MAGKDEKIAVALVEDTPSVRDNLAELMRESGDFEVIGIYGTLGNITPTWLPRATPAADRPLASRRTLSSSRA